MKFLKPALCISLALFISITIPVSAGAVEAPEPSPRPWDTYVSSSGTLLDSATAAQAAILIDANTGKVLYEKNADKKLYPASITKIMTCLLVLENCQLSDVVTIPDIGELDKEATKIGIKPGEWMTVEELLYGLMLMSGNDAAVALAKHISGSIEGFAELMNQKCAELGMTNTHFVNPHGLHDDNHVTTARDMALLTKEAMKYPEFVKIVSTAFHTISGSGTNADLGGIGEWENHNRLILPNDAYAYEFATGVKTGFTTPAQHTLVASAKKDNLDLIAVMLNDTDLGKWDDAITMFMYGYKYYDTINLAELLATEPMYADVSNAAGDGQLELRMETEGPSYYTDTKQAIEELRADPGRFQVETSYDIPLVAPITKDTQVGTATFSLDGQVYLTSKLYAANDIAPAPTNTPEPTNLPATPAPEIGIMQNDLLLYITGGLIAVFLLILLLTLISKGAKNHKPKKHAQRYSSDRSRRRH